MAVPLLRTTELLFFATMTTLAIYTATAYTITVTILNHWFVLLVPSTAVPFTTMTTIGLLLLWILIMVVLPIFWKELSLAGPLIRQSYMMFIVANTDFRIIGNGNPMTS